MKPDTKVKIKDNAFTGLTILNSKRGKTVSDKSGSKDLLYGLSKKTFAVDLTSGGRCFVTKDQVDVPD